MNNSADPQWTIRRAAPEDADSVFRFLAPFVAARQLLPRTVEELAALMTHAFVVHSDIVVGFAAVEIYSKKLAEIQCLAVAPGFQGKGIGKRIINLCIEHARQQKVHELMAITSSEGPFADCGFHYSLPDQKRAMFIQTNDPHEGQQGS